jgi:hypothetical protein
MRVCLVTPYAWDRPSEANDHWSALARALARRGHEVVILAPARKPALLMEGRRRLRALAQGDAAALTPSPRVPLVVAVGLGVPVATGAAARSVPIPVAVAAGVRLALVRGRFDAVDVLDPAPAGPSAVALRETPTPVVATFFRGGPSLRRARGAERLAARADTVAAVSPAAAEAVLQRFGLQATVTGVAVDRDRFARTSATAPPLVAVEATLGDAGALRALFSELAPTTAEIALLRSAGSAALRSLVPSALAGRVRLPDASTPAARAAALRGASMFIAARNGSPLIAREAAACGVPIIAVAGSPGSFGVEHEVSGLIAQEGQPALVAACAGRLLADEPLRARLAAAASPDGADVVAERVEALYSRAPRPRRPPAEPDPAPPILCDFHMHTDHSPDCETSVPDLVARALDLGLGAIAVTDHNTIAGGLAAQAYVAERGLPLHVIACRSPTRSRRFAPRVPSSTCRTPSTGCTRFRILRCCAGWRIRSTCSRPATAGSTARRTTARRSGSPSATTCWPGRAPTRTCWRASRRHVSSYRRSATPSRCCWRLPTAKSCATR